MAKYCSMAYMVIMMFEIRSIVLARGENVRSVLYRFVLLTGVLEDWLADEGSS